MIGFTFLVMEEFRLGCQSMCVCVYCENSIRPDRETYRRDGFFANGLQLFRVEEQEDGNPVALF